MRSPRTLIPIPARVAAAVDKIAGHRQRTAFVVEVLEREIRRREQLEALEAAVGAWRDEEHPELANGAEAWIREMRDRSLARAEENERDRESR